MDFASGVKIKKREAEIAGARTLKQKCNLLIDAAMELRQSDPIESLQEAQKALTIAEEINFGPGKARSYFCIGAGSFYAFVFPPLLQERYNSPSLQ